MPTCSSRPVAQHRDPVAEIERLVLLVGHQHGRDADAADELADLAPGPLAQRRVEVGERLVQQQHPRLRRQRPGQRHPLLLAARELADPPLLEPGEIHQRQSARHPPVAARRRVRRSDSRPKATFSPDVEMREQGVVLEHHAEAPGHRLDAG